MHEEDRRDIVDFGTALRKQGLNLGRVTKYIYTLKVIGRYLEEKGAMNTSFRNATKELIEQFYLYVMEETGYTPHTKRDYS